MLIITLSVSDKPYNVMFNLINYKIKTIYITEYICNIILTFNIINYNIKLYRFIYSLTYISQNIFNQRLQFN